MRSDKGIPKYSDLEMVERHSCPEPNSGCWLWMADANTWGYGRVGRGRGERLAHRLSYRAHVGQIPKGMKVLHKCDTPPCVNPRHLFLGTLSANVQDALAKGRHAAPSGEENPHAKLTHIAVSDIRTHDRTGRNIAMLAGRHGVSRRAVALVMEGKTWAR